MLKNYLDAEQYILEKFVVGNSFIYKNKEYKINIVGKPSCSKGEPKTDIYIATTSNELELFEFKISFKKDNADFLENKIKSKRAEQLLGNDWSSIICDSTEFIKDKFYSKPLIYKNKFGHTDAGSITLGWKFELVNKKGGNLSSKIILSKNQLIDVYSGINLSMDKKDSSVNDNIIKNSGVANFILFKDKSFSLNNAQDVIDSIIPIDEYVDNHTDIYFACKALNYRSFKDKYDGDRALAVYVNWFVRNQKLAYEIVFDKPLEYGGNFVYSNLREALDKLNVKTTDDLNSSNVEDTSIIFE